MRAILQESDNVFVDMTVPKNAELKELQTERLSAAVGCANFAFGGAGVPGFDLGPNGAVTDLHDLQDLSKAA